MQHAICEKGAIQSSELITSKTSDLSPRLANLPALCGYPTGAYSRCATLSAYACPHTDRRPLNVLAPDPSKYFGRLFGSFAVLPGTYLSRGVKHVYISLMRLTGTEIVEREECLDQDIDLHSLKQDYPPRREKTNLFPALEQQGQLPLYFLG